MNDILVPHIYFFLFLWIEFGNFISSLINQNAFDKVTGYIKEAKTSKSSDIEILAGGTCTHIYKISYYI